MGPGCVKTNSWRPRRNIESAGGSQKGIIFALIGGSIGGLPVGIGKRGQLAEKTGSGLVVNRRSAGGAGKRVVQNSTPNEGRNRDSGSVSHRIKDGGFLFGQRCRALATAFSVLRSASCQWQPPFARPGTRFSGRGLTRKMLVHGSVPLEREVSKPGAMGCQGESRSLPLSDEIAKRERSFSWIVVR